MKKYILLILFSTLSQSYSQAVSDTIVVYKKTDDGKFHFVTDFTSGEKVYVMVENRNEGDVLLWVKFIYPPKTIKNKKGKLIKLGSNYDLIHLKMYCQDRTYDKEKAIRYNSKGVVLKTDNVPQYKVSIIPDSLFDHVRKYTCY